MERVSESYQRVENDFVSRNPHRYCEQTLTVTAGPIVSCFERELERGECLCAWHNLSQTPVDRIRSYDSSAFSRS